MAYDRYAIAPRFLAFMVDIFRDDADREEKTQAVLEMIGYSLMSHCRHERFVVLVGQGANGKSVLLTLIEALLGSSNVTGVQPAQFDRAFQRAHLHRKLANIVTEIRQGEVIDEASLKGIVSGELSTVEHKHKDPFEIRPFATCWFGTNHMPHTRDFSDALFRRALVLRFNQVFKPELGNCDPNLKDKLIAELPGILNLAIDAYARALVAGFTTPVSSKQAREQWRLQADQVAQFVEAECIVDPSGRIEPQRFYDAYRRWADECGIRKTVARSAFLARLELLGYSRGRSSGRRHVRGLTCSRVILPFRG